MKKYGKRLILAAGTILLVGSGSFTSFAATKITNLNLKIEDTLQVGAD